MGPKDETSQHRISMPISKRTTYRTLQDALRTIRDLSWSSNIILGVGAILATFIATFSAVFLAIYLERQQEQQKSTNSFLSLVNIMDTDCRESRMINQKLDPADPEANLRKAQFLYNSALQNSLLFEHMDRAQLVNMMSHMSRASFLFDKYDAAHTAAHKKGGREMVAEMKKFYERLGIPTAQMESMSKILRMMEEEFEQNLVEMKVFFASYLEEEEKLCDLLSHVTDGQNMP